MKPSNNWVPLDLVFHSLDEVTCGQFKVVVKSAFEHDGLSIFRSKVADHQIYIDGLGKVTIIEFLQGRMVIIQCSDRYIEKGKHRAHTHCEDESLVDLGWMDGGWVDLLCLQDRLPRFDRMWRWGTLLVYLGRVGLLDLDPLG